MKISKKPFLKNKKNPQPKARDFNETGKRRTI
jgi:hypothetical protein